MFLKDSMILELLASWKYEKQPVMTTTPVSTIPRYNWGREQTEKQVNICTGVKSKAAVRDIRINLSRRYFYSLSPECDGCVNEVQLVQM